MNKRTAYIVFAFIATYIIWGTTYIAISFGLTGFGPFSLSSFRYLAAGFSLFLFCLIGKKVFPKGKDLLVTAVSGIIMLVGGSGLICWAEQTIHSGHAAVLIATEPFFFILLDRKRWSFYRRRKKILFGLTIGFAGVIWFVCFTANVGYSALKVSSTNLGIAVLLISAILWVLGSLFSKTADNKNVSLSSVISVQLLAAGVFCFILSILLHEKIHLSLVSGKAWLSLVYLIIFGSIIAYFAFNWLMTVRPPAQVSTHTYVNPIVALFVGWLLNNEPVSVMQVIGLVIILIGVMLTNMEEKPLMTL